ncbi:hypothetical protein L1987_75729 [Smallanthus sonchifolius]|uniref:Uncharacterized protein n=1 Tax=Smallanthus sonchifolius TaxID=185202 RepID=A0ACB9AAP1_9ASTR|nr:hypothetical protein L1987_75729 [Smallanthus sonchifolius]
MEGQTQSQRVVLAHDASRGMRVNSLRVILDKLLKAGDMFTLLSIVYQIQHPMGYMMRVDSSMFGVNQRAIDDEVAKKKKEYEKNIDLVQVLKLYEMQKVDFKIEWVAGSIPKNVVVEASKKFNATWVILDRRMKRDKKYFLQKLSCGISTMKRNDDIIKLRGPKQSTTTRLSYDEMLPVDNKNFVREEAQNDEDLFSIEFGSSCSKLNVMVKVQTDTKKYKSEMQALEETRGNENVIMLLGSCLQEGPRMVVFEYACNGSLDQHLSQQNTRALTWPERIKIAIGACRGLYHLHVNNIIHGDMRPKNILLTHDFQPLIAGFGLASMKNESQNSSNHYIIGTLGYLAPEYKERGKATTKTDVYAFGTILLQLITGLSPTDTRLQGQSLIKWVNSLVKEGKFVELIDPGIAYDINEVVIVVLLALKCVRKDPHIRLSMEKVMFTLDYIKDEKASYKGKVGDEVNKNVETIGQSQHTKLVFSYGGMTPVPKQAKHFYQSTSI